MHSVMGFEMGGFSIDFPTATVGALVPLFGGVFPLRSHSRVEEGERPSAPPGSCLSSGLWEGLDPDSVVTSLSDPISSSALAAHRGGLDGSVLVQVQQALGDGDQRAVILPGIPRVTVFLGHLRSGGRSRSASGAPHARHRSAVRNGNQTLGSHEVHVGGGCGHGAGDSSPAARPNLAVAARFACRALASDYEPRRAVAKGAGARGA